MSDTIEEQVRNIKSSYDTLLGRVKSSDFDEALYIGQEILDEVLYRNFGIELYDILVDTHFRMGYASLKVKKPEKALFHYNTLLKIDSYAEDAKKLKLSCRMTLYYNRGNAFFDLGRLEDAISCYDVVIDLSSSPSREKQEALIIKTRGKVEKASAKTIEESYNSKARHNKNQTETRLKRKISM